MNQANTQTTNHQVDTQVDDSGVTTQDLTLTPMERWARERAEEQPWNALTSKTNVNSGGYSSGRGTSSTRGQSGSVGGEVKLNECEETEWEWERELHLQAKGL
jgi:hypothetical protein